MEPTLNSKYQKIQKIVAFKCRPDVYVTLLSLQAYYGHCEALRLLSETLVSLDVRDIEGRTALHLAAQRGFVSCVEMLLKHQASYKLKEHKRKWTALHAAGVCAGFLFKMITCLICVCIFCKIWIVDVHNGHCSNKKIYGENKC